MLKEKVASTKSEIRIGSFMKKLSDGSGPLHQSLTQLVRYALTYLVGFLFLSCRLPCDHMILFFFFIFLFLPVINFNMFCPHSLGSYLVIVS